LPKDRWTLRDNASNPELRYPEHVTGIIDCVGHQGQPGSVECSDRFVVEHEIVDDGGRAM
jgi:hypothetical protein